MRIVTTMMLTLALLLGACSKEAPSIKMCGWERTPTPCVTITIPPTPTITDHKPMLSIEQMMDRMNARDGSYPEQVRER